MRTWASAGALLCATALCVASCGGEDENGDATGGAGGSGAVGTGATAGSGGDTGGSSGGGGTGATAGTGAAGAGGTSGDAGIDGGGTGGGSQVPPYDTQQKNREQCQFGPGKKTTESIGPNVPHGDALPFDHIVVLMLENRSFDHYFSKLPNVGVTDVDVAPDNVTNPDPANGGAAVPRFKETRYCIEDVNHEWDGTHDQYNGGAMDGFVATNNPGGARTMGYYDEKDLGWYYWMAKTFAISDRHFCSLLGPTWPNRFFFYASTAWGTTHTGTIDPVAQSKYNTAPRITDQLEAAGKTWKIYRDGITSFAVLFGLNSKNLGVHIAELQTDVNNDTLPNLAIIDPSFTGAQQNDEHPPANVQLGQQFTKKVYDMLTSNPAVWKKTVFIVVYDEHGGFYDHVPPPKACKPDFLEPSTHAFDRLGFRTPLLVASPWTKPGYVSHIVTDITSITRFIQNRFDLGALTIRDGSAWPLLDMFDFSQMSFPNPPGGAPSAVPDPAGVSWCANNKPGTGTP